MFNKIGKFILSIILFLKKFILKLIENINNLCMFCAICGILYSPLLFLDAENYFDIAKFCLIFLFFAIDVLMIGRK